MPAACGRVGPRRLAGCVWTDLEFAENSAIIQELPRRTNSFLPRGFPGIPWEFLELRHANNLRAKGNKRDDGPTENGDCLSNLILIHHLSRMATAASAAALVSPPAADASLPRREYRDEDQSYLDQQTDDLQNDLQSAGSHSDHDVQLSAMPLTPPKRTQDDRADTVPVPAAASGGPWVWASMGLAKRSPTKAVSVDAIRNLFGNASATGSASVSASVLVSPRTPIAAQSSVTAAPSPPARPGSADPASAAAESNCKPRSFVHVALWTICLTTALGVLAALWYGWPTMHAHRIVKALPRGISTSVRFLCSMCIFMRLQCFDFSFGTLFIHSHHVRSFKTHVHRVPTIRLH
jgi:hypothetical protein